ncbi:Trp biosynthesis-associated membrane protein [Haloglycomyces albus]|uniref:Trp biosynthesis-associated membrane protein n=1 Tax=Haloglycomyces albus TaxID=526067 RepID=UPI00046D7DFB|nr:Trp biosynthesis-associated membrane protein [Haloglycomyces albus]
MNISRLKGITVVSGIAVNALAAYLVTRDWTTRTEADDFGLSRDVTQSGTDVIAWALPVSLAGAAAFLVLLALSGTVTRRVVAALIVPGSLAVAIGAGLRWPDGVQPLVVAACAVVSALLAVIVWRTVPQWPRRVAKYERSAQTDVGDDPAALWAALDQGRDPSSPNIAATADATDADKKGKNT